MKFTDWYTVQKGATVLTVTKNEQDIDKYKNNKYDCIYLEGVLENASLLIKSKQPEVDLIKFFKNLLNENGTILVAVNNRMGVRNFVGNKSEHCKEIYDSLYGNFENGKLFSKTELNAIIEQTGFDNCRYYYPLPNYNNINVIYTDEKIIDKDDSKINYNFVYEKDSLIVGDELKLLKSFIKEGKFSEYTNSFIVELSNKTICKDVKYYSFNNMRKPEYSLVLKMMGDCVKKYPLNEKANNHIKNINKNSKKLKELGFSIAEEETDENIVISKFIKYETLDKVIANRIEKNEIQQVYEIIQNWYEHICSKLIPNEQGKIKYGFIDLVFENTFWDHDNCKYIFFDQEWFMENVEIKYILYRAINNLYIHNSRIEEKIERNKLFEKYGINVEKYLSNENKLQEMIIDKEQLRYYQEQYKYLISFRELQKIITDIKRFDKDNLELIQEQKRLVEEIETLSDKIKTKDEKIKMMKNEPKKGFWTKKY